MDDAKQQLIEKLQSSNNILVTVSRDPSVDQLASCIGLTLLLNKMGKHAAAVFSGKVPSTLEFLQPDATLEKNTDSLRDFIISLDKTKADKLRYKVEEDVVRIFITPYKTSLSQEDLEFSEGDFNVDVVVALGVKKQEDLDQAITAHGRILHDATVASVNTSADGGLGTINWYDPQASSLSEMVTDLVQALDDKLLDEQTATALLTGIVSETGRFSNDKTSSQTMSVSAALMSAGANQQLVATKLESKPSASSDSGNQAVAEPDASAGDDGVLNIDHADDAAAGSPAPEASDMQPPPGPGSQPGDDNFLPPEPPAPGGADGEQPPKPSDSSTLTPGARLMTEPPRLGGALTANTQDEQLDPVTDPLSMPESEPPRLLPRKQRTPPPKPGPSKPYGPAAEPNAPPAAGPVPSSASEPPAPKHPPAPPPAHASAAPPPAPAPPAPAGKDKDDVTLTELEKSVDSPHVSAQSQAPTPTQSQHQSPAPSDLESVRDEINQALAGSDPAKPIEALNAQPLGGELHPPASAPPPAPEPPSPESSASQPPKPGDSDEKGDDSGPGAPPPVPPPIPFQFGNTPPPPA